MQTLRSGCVAASLSGKCYPLLSVFQISPAARRSAALPVCDAVGLFSRQISPFSMRKSRRLCSLVAASPIHESSEKGMETGNLSTRARKKAKRENPESLLKHKLDMCSRNGDLKEALGWYDYARREGIKLGVHHYNSLLYLCVSGSSVSSGDSVDNGRGSDIEMGLKRGVEILEQMHLDGVDPNEATFTNAARLAAARDDPEMAFSLVKKMQGFGIPPRLRSYGPALFSFCKNGQAEKAYEVDGHMRESEVLAEEPELAALVKLSADIGNADKVYEMLHRLRVTVRQVSEPTAGDIEEWFWSKAAAETGERDWDVEKVKEGVVKGGGGWHGQGWLGRGKWTIARSEMNEKGICQKCGENLVCIDIDPRETEKFASSLASLACQREAKTNFVQFQDWLKEHGPFDAVIDGANVSLVNQKNFNFRQLNIIVNKLREISPTKKLPLVILHTSRVHGGAAKIPYNKKLLDHWKNAGALYATPPGSNDDWYWLYAAVSSKCLLVTNDEMRDHLFQLLGNSFFPIWKEKHQVRLTVTPRTGPSLHMPPPYSIVIQESEQGSWHVPTVTGDDLEAPRQWLCVTRES
uniref:ribonuclease P n=1 Tax=Kalanchoe fedtschenkoi TaxID=63787 RepID=A0A7N0T721_KALFE